MKLVPVQSAAPQPVAADQTGRDLGDALEITATEVETEFLLPWLRGWGKNDALESVVGEPSHY